MISVRSRCVQGEDLKIIVRASLGLHDTKIHYRNDTTSNSYFDSTITKLKILVVQYEFDKPRIVSPNFFKNVLNDLTSSGGIGVSGDELVMITLWAKSVSGIASKKAAFFTEDTFI